MPEHTIALIRRRALEFGMPRLADLAEKRTRAGFAKFGAHNHRECGEDWLQHAVEEAVDWWAYMAFEERAGRRIPEELWATLACAINGLLILYDVRDYMSGAVRRTGTSVSEKGTE